MTTALDIAEGLECLPVGPDEYLPDFAEQRAEAALDEWLRLLEQLEALSELRVGECDEVIRLGAKETLVAVILLLEHHRGLLTQIAVVLTEWLDDVTLPGELVVLDDVGRYRVGDSPVQKYDNVRRASMFASRLSDEIVDPKTGEVPPVGVIVEAAVMATAKALGGLAPARSWNKTPLRERGLDPDQFVTESTRGPRRLKADA